MFVNWSHFDVNAIEEIIKSSDMAGELMDRIEKSGEDPDIILNSMNQICPVPDVDSIRKYRTVLEQNIFKSYPEVMRKIFREANIKGSTYNEKQMNMTKGPLTSSLITAYIKALSEISGDENAMSETSKFSTTVALNMKNTVTEEVPLYDFQKKAVEKLKEHFIDNDRESGLLVMPTGSGKSRTAVYFLIKEMISRGWQILWLCHRHMLIDQAAECFYRFAGLSKTTDPDIRNYRISCVSGEHMPLKAVSKDEIIVASVASVCRSKAHLRRVLKDKVMLVVDEAHHSVAPSYRDTIEFIKKCRSHTKLLGLTATPVRTNENENSTLFNIYGRKIIYSVSMSELIASGILASPEFEEIETEEDFEPLISEKETSLINRFGELPESVLGKIASSHARNQLIVKTYLDNREKYGKTLIFALNVIHCRFLYEELKSHGVKCGVIFSGNDCNTAEINDFKENKIDVLINVNIMTEGTDVPDIETVFLTRPTASEGLLMQMIGRGMRGTAAHGTEKVNIVDFHDKWDIFNKWLNPEFIYDRPGELPDKKEYVWPEYKKYEWKLFLSAYKSMKRQNISYSTSVSVPVAWYTLIDEDGELYRMLIFENQKKGLIDMIRDKNIWKDDPSYDAEYMIRKYFSYFCFRPSEKDISLLIDNFRNSEDEPQIHIVEKRKEAEPSEVIKQAQEKHEDIFEYAGKVYDSSDIARDLYESRESYIMEICRRKVYGNQDVRTGYLVEELPYEKLPYDPAPFYDLDELLKEVKDEMFDGTYDGIKSISWTDKPYKTFLGVYYPDDTILINCVLDSRDVPKEAVKYIIYHELLHRDYKNHGTDFREEEYKFPHYEDAEFFLAGKLKDLDIKEW